MAPRPPVHSHFTANRAAALVSQALMRATIADMRETIQNTRKLINDGREAIRRLDALLRPRVTAAATVQNSE